MVTSAWHDWEWWHDYEKTHDEYLANLVKSLMGHQREMYELRRELGSGIAQSLDRLGFELMDT